MSCRPVWSSPFAVLVMGAVLYLLRHGAEVPHYSRFRGTPADLRSLVGLTAGIAHGSARALLQTGILIMIATPVFRVAFAVYAFARRRDLLYTAISTIVLALLAAGWFLER